MQSVALVYIDFWDEAAFDLFVIIIEAIVNFLLSISHFKIRR